jgi:Amt family ammonium transporter
VETKLDIAWVLLCAALVFAMQAGFLCLESGLTRSKNSIHVALKNLTDFAISVLIFWGSSFAVMFGPSLAGWVGTSPLAPSFGLHDPEGTAFFVFQAMFCGTAVTIVSGAVAERMHFRGYLLVVVLMSAVIYSLFGHWAWNGMPGGPLTGWLGRNGYYDFAGSSVVHCVGGWVSLAAMLVIGPRLGRFAEDGTVRRIQGSNLPVAMLGALLLWFGWFGFNGGSALAMTDQVPHILSNTMLAGSSGMVMAILVGYWLYGYPHVGFAINGSLAGLVAITASCNAVSSFAAVVIGAVGAAVMVAGTLMLERWKIDDVVGAVATHAGAGTWGVVAVALFGQPEVLGTGLDYEGQLLIQLAGAGTCFAWAFGLSYLVLKITNRFTPLRVSAEAERTGLNYTEHNETTELLELFRAMSDQAERGDITIRLPVEPNTEVGQIASHYNGVLEALQHALARTQMIVQGAMDGIVMFARDGLIERLNPSAELLFGYREAEVIGKPVSMLVGIHGQGRLPSLVPGEAATGIQELVGRRRDRGDFPVEAVVTAVGEGNQGFFAAMFRDITTRKQAERALLEAKDAAEAANQMKSNFLASMSHELRTPLNAIIGYSEMLIEDVDEQQPQTASDLHKIRQAGKHLLSLINDVLDLSKIEAGRLDLFLESFDLAKLVRETEVLIQPLAQAQANQLEIRVAADATDMHADETRVRQCLSNLLSNACKFTREGRVTLEIDLVGAGDGQAVRFRVTDTGIGITPAQQTKLFEAFVQADASTTRKYGGTGLGLAISQRFCRAMGGEISVQSEHGRGSTFTMLVPRRVVQRPLDVAPRERLSSVPMAIAPERRGTVLVIDDDGAVRELIERFLRREGFEVATASGGEEGLEMAARLKPVAITLDVVMPGMDGWAVLRKLQDDDRLAGIPVIMVTMTDDMGKGFALGATDFLTKPVERARLLTILDRVRAQGRVGNVLVVEDDPSSVEVLTRLLQREQCEVRTAGNGIHALRSVAEQAPDLILLDLMMPEMNGFELVTELRRNPAWRPIPIVVVTAKELTREDRAHLDGHVERIFRKGAIERDEFLREVRDLLNALPLTSGRGGSDG